MASRSAAVVEREEEQLIQWRFQELQRGGYDDRSAACLAKHLEVDLHLALDLLAQGCPPGTALRILL